MPINMINQLDQTGVMKDTPAIALPANAFSNVRNVRFDNFAVNKMPGHKQVFDYWELTNDSDSTGTRVVGEDFGYDLRQQAARSGITIQANDDIIFCRYWPSPIGALYVFATTERVYVITPEGTVYDVSRRNASDTPINFSLRGELDASWDSTIFAGGQAFIMNNGVNVPHYMIFEGNVFDQDQRVTALTGLQLRPLPGWSYYYSNLPTVARQNDVSFLSSGAGNGQGTVFTFLNADGNAEPISVAEGSGNLADQFAVFVDNRRLPDAEYTLTVDNVTFTTAPANGARVRIFRHTIPFTTTITGFGNESDYAVLFSDADDPAGPTIDPTFYTLTASQFSYDIPAKDSEVANEDFFDNLYSLRGLDLFVGRRIRTTCGIIRGFEQVLVAGNLTEIDETDESTIRRLAGTVRVSNLAEPGQVPTSWDPFASGADTADEFELSSLGVVREMQPLQGQLLIYTSGSIHSMSLTGNIAIPIAIGNITDVYGALAANSVHEFDGQHVVVGSNDIYIFPGHPANIQSIADRRIRDYFFSNLHPVYTDRIQMARNRAHDEIWIGYPTYDSPFGDMDEAIIWNYRYNTWTIRDLPNARSLTVGPVTGGGVPSGEVTINVASDNNLQNGIRALFPGNYPLQEFQVDPDLIVYTGFANRPSHQRLYINDITPYTRDVVEDFEIVMVGTGDTDVEASHFDITIDPDDTFIFDTDTDSFSVTFTYEDVHFKGFNGANTAIVTQTIPAADQSDTDGSHTETITDSEVFHWAAAQDTDSDEYRPLPAQGEVITMAEFWLAVVNYMNSRHIPPQTPYPFTTWGLGYNGVGNSVRMDSAVRGARRFQVTNSGTTTTTAVIDQIGTGIFARGNPGATEYLPARALVSYHRDGTLIYSNVYTMGPNSGRQLYDHLYNQFINDSELLTHFTISQEPNSGLIRMVALVAGDVTDEIIFDFFGAFTDADGNALEGGDYSTNIQANGGTVKQFKTIHGATIGERTDVEFQGTAGGEQPPTVNIEFPVSLPGLVNNNDPQGRNLAIPIGGTNVDDSDVGVKIARAINYIDGWTATLVDSDSTRPAYIDLVSDTDGPTFLLPNGNERLFNVTVSANPGPLTDSDFFVKSIRQGTLLPSGSPTFVDPVLTFSNPQPVGADDLDITLTGTGNEINATEVARQIATSSVWDDTVWSPYQAGAIAQWVIPGTVAVAADRIIYSITVDGGTPVSRTLTLTAGQTAQEVAVALAADINTITGVSAEAPGTATTQDYNGIPYHVYPFARSSAIQVRSENTTAAGAIDINWTTWEFGDSNPPEAEFNTSNDAIASDVIFLSNSGADIANGIRVKSIEYNNSGNPVQMLNVSSTLISTNPAQSVNPFDEGNTFNPNFSFTTDIIRTGSAPQFYGYPTTYVMNFQLNAEAQQEYRDNNGLSMEDEIPFHVLNNYYAVVIGNQDPDYRPRHFQESLAWLNSADTDNPDLAVPVVYGDDNFLSFNYTLTDSDGGIVLRDGRDTPLRVGSNEVNDCVEALRGIEIPVIALDSDGNRIQNVSAAVTTYQGDSDTGIVAVDTQGAILGRAITDISDFRVTYPSNLQRNFQFFAGELTNTRVLSIDTSFTIGRRVINRGDGIPVNYHDRMQPFVGDRSLGTKATGGLNDANTRFRTNYDAERPWGEDEVNEAREYIVALDRAQSCLFGCDLSLQFGSYGPGGVDEKTRPNSFDTMQGGMTVVVPIRLSHPNGDYESFIERQEFILDNEEYTKDPMAFYFRVKGDVPSYLDDTRREEANRLYLNLWAHDSPGGYERFEPFADPMITDFIIGFDYKLDTRINGRLLHLRISDKPKAGFDIKPRRFNWSLTGIDMDVEQTGRR